MATIKYKDENGWQEIAIGGGESVEVVDNLESESTTAALSAYQGRVLKEMIDNIPSGEGGGGGGLELRELKMSGSADDNAYNLETLELMKENKVLPATNVGDGTLVPLTYCGNGLFILQVVLMGIEMQMSLTMAGDGSVTMSQEAIAPYVLSTPSVVKNWFKNNSTLMSLGRCEPAFIFYNYQLCLVDYYEVTGNDTGLVQFNYRSRRFERFYDVATGEEISTTEIPIGGGVTEQKVEEMIAASVGDIKASIVAINGEEV